MTFSYYIRINIIIFNTWRQGNPQHVKHMGNTEHPKLTTDKKQQKCKCDSDKYGFQTQFLSNRFQHPHYSEQYVHLQDLKFSLAADVEGKNLDVGMLVFTSVFTTKCVCWDNCIIHCKWFPFLVCIVPPLGLQIRQKKKTNKTKKGDSGILHIFFIFSN